MFPFPIAKPQGCDIQTFYGSGSSNVTLMSWNKPVGVSHVYMMLIGAGGNGDDASSGGGSGAVSVWYGAAQHVPNNLIVRPGNVSNDTRVFFSNGGTNYTLVVANQSTGATAGAASVSNYFTASGFYNSVAGQDYALTQTAPTTTFLGGGGSSAVTGNYGYTVADNKTGYFMMQPIIVGVGSSASGGKAGVGCGGGYSLTGGGPSMVLIASW